MAVLNSRSASRGSDTCEIELLIDGLTDDVAFVWVLIHLGLRSNPPVDAGPPSGIDVDRAFATLDRLGSDGLIAVGHLEYLEPGPPNRVAPVKHVSEPLQSIRERVDAACVDGEWEWSCWIVNTEKGDAVARSAIKEDDR